MVLWKRVVKLTPLAFSMDLNSSTPSLGQGTSRKVGKCKKSPFPFPMSVFKNVHPEFPSCAKGVETTLG